LVDDEWPVAQGLALALQSAGLTVVGCTNTIADAYDMAREMNLSIVVARRQLADGSAHELRSRLLLDQRFVPILIPGEPARQQAALVATEGFTLRMRHVGAVVNAVVLTAAWSPVRRDARLARTSLEGKIVDFSDARNPHAALQGGSAGLE
jgi:hypothetical protein